MLPASIQVCPVELPGRGRRQGEAAINGRCQAGGRPRRLAAVAGMPQQPPRGLCNSMYLAEVCSGSSATPYALINLPLYRIAGQAIRAVWHLPRRHCCL